VSIRAFQADPVPQDHRLEIEVQTSENLVSSKEIGDLKSWLAQVVSSVAPEVDSLGVKLTDDAAMQEINRHYRGQNKSTDVLSFSGSESPEGKHLGDILISTPQAERQANEVGISLFQELQLLLLHGTLHCLGYDHEVDDGTMERLERDLRGHWIDGTNDSD